MNLFAIIKKTKTAVAIVLILQLLMTSILLPLDGVLRTYAAEHTASAQSPFSWNADTHTFQLNAASFESAVTYELSYTRAPFDPTGTDAELVEEGVRGTIDAGETEEVFAGVCSDNVCTRHDIKSGTLQILTLDEETVLYETTFTLNDGVWQLEEQSNKEDEEHSQQLQQRPHVEKNAQLISYEEYISTTQVLVTFRPYIDASGNPIEDEPRVKSFAEREELEIKDGIESTDTVVMAIDEEKTTISETITELKMRPEVQSVEPVFIRKSLAEYDEIPLGTNDTYADVLWGLYNYGQPISGTAGTADADIDAPAAWQLSEGADVVVAVIDTGVAYQHPDLKQNMWNGEACVDDRNTPIPGGCLHGYDFEHGDNNPLPSSNEHGTNVAGTIAAVKNNSAGIVGVAPRVKIMAIKTDFSTPQLIKAIRFAKNNGADIINASFGGYGYSQQESDAIAEFTQVGGIFVAAAGNYTSNNDTNPFYPANYDNPHIISVAATTSTDSLAYFSNYGVQTVDIAAPGTSIFSTAAQTSTATVVENFDQVSEPALPQSWTINGTFGTYKQENQNIVLYGDRENTPYKGNTTATAQAHIDLSHSTSADISFFASCDTEYNTTSWSDYMTVSISENGMSFFPILRFDEVSIDRLTNDLGNDEGHASITFQNLPIFSGFLTKNFVLRFEWKTNASGHGTAGDGCFIDDIVIKKTGLFDDGSHNQYTYKSGTSMAAPHVTGVAALIKSYDKSLTNTDIKETILTTGDPLYSLEGKIQSGKRVNAYLAVASLIQENEPPVAGDDVYETPEDTMLEIPIAALLENDSDHQGDALTFVSAQDPVQGTISTNAETGVIQFTPTAEFSGTASFSYTIRDPAGLEDTAMVTITVTPVNDPPVIHDQHVSTKVFTQLILLGPLKDSEGDTLRYSITTAPSHGSAVIFRNVLVYTPKRGYKGMDTIKVTVFDTEGLSDEATIHIAVKPAPILLRGIIFLLMKLK